MCQQQPAAGDKDRVSIRRSSKCRDLSPADPRDVLLSRELLLRQTILTSGVWLIFIGFGAYLNTGEPHDSALSGVAGSYYTVFSLSASCAA